MNLSDLEDLIQELKQEEDNVDIQLDKIDITNSSKTEYLTIYYWNQYGFEDKIEKKISIIE